MVATRDYLSVKLWDIRGTVNSPIQSLQVCDYLEKNLVNLYEEDSIYDRFFLDISPCSNYILTGSYNKSGHIIDVGGNHNVTIATSFDHKIGKTIGKVRKYGTNKKIPALEGLGAPDFGKKVL